MSKINILGNEISDLIAAGEVVERPASVVKELVENSIDAGSSKITVEIREGGLEYIRVTDNGCGMSSEDAGKAFLKHATSKIMQKDDLYSIHTLGFRGEALAAISAVSKISLKTKEKDSVSGYSLRIEGGVVVDESETGAADGTTFEVRDLFYNTPARLKFVKGEAAERAVINSLVEKLAISHKNIAFTYIVNGSTRFFTQGNGNLADTVFSVYGKDLAGELTAVDHDSEKIKVNGFTGRPLANKANRNFQLFFVNGRLVKSKILQQALEISYRNSMLVGRYPICILFIEVDTSEIDVNVHPSKLEIKFSDEKGVAEAVSAGVREGLAKESGIYSINLDKKTVPSDKQTEISVVSLPGIESDDSFKNRKASELTIKPVQRESLYSVDTKQKQSEKTISELKPEVKRINDWEITSYKKSNSISHETPKRSEKRVDTPIPREPVGVLRSDPQDALRQIIKYTEEHPLDIPQNEIEQEITLIQDKKAEYKYIGEVFNSFIIIEENDELVFIDKHALHERMIFENLKKTNLVEVQTLLIPKVCLMGETASEILMNNKDNLKKIGFDIEDFGGSILVREIPVITESADIEALLNTFAEELRVRNSVGEELLDSFLYSIACKAAIKSGWKTSETELRSMVDDYMNHRDSLKYCPHGRPIVFTLSKKSMEKQFKRIV